MTIHRRRKQERLKIMRIHLEYLFYSCLMICSTAVHVDVEYPNVELHNLAFGSCHNRKKALQRLQQSNISTTIWDQIPNNVQGFVWTGDTIYSPVKQGVASVDLLRIEYDEMLNNPTLGYSHFLDRLQSRPDSVGVFGSWDDHDYGANDAGSELSMRKDFIKRQDAFLDFLNVPKNSETRHRKGVYSCALFGSKHKVMLILLDTRTHRQSHCIPSWASIHIPLVGSIGGTLTALFACLTRWFTASILLHPWFRPIFANQCTKRQILGEEQWHWLEELLDTYKTENVSAHIVVSSIQLLTTNPAPESWGHFDIERTRLLKLLSKLPGLVVLSGDVHHAEIASWQTKSAEIVEVTSSGLTHSVLDMGSLIVPVAKWQMNLFHHHRRRNQESFYVGRNFGTINFDWETKSAMTVNVHDDTGKVVLSTGEIHLNLNQPPTITDEDVQNIFKITSSQGWGAMSVFVSFNLFVLIAILWLYARQARKVKSKLE